MEEDMERRMEQTRSEQDARWEADLQQKYSNNRMYFCFTQISPFTV